MTDRINQFRNHFERSLDEVNKIGPVYFQKSLCFSILEAVAKGRFIDCNRPSVRFYSLVENHCDWTDANRVSLPQVRQQLHAGASGLSDTLLSAINRWPRCVGSSRALSSDPRFEEVMVHCRSNDDKRFITLLRHDHLLYGYRSALVHEARQAGYGMDHPDDQPFYHGMTDVKSGDETIEIAYPLAFIKDLVTCALESVSEFYQKESIDPYTRYPFGTLIHRVFRGTSQKMATLTIRGLEEGVLAALKARATRNHWSLEAAVRQILRDVAADGSLKSRATQPRGSR